MTEKIDHVILVSREQSTSHGITTDDTSIILKTQETDKSGFELGEKVKLLHAIHDNEVAMATISSMTSSTLLYNQIQPHGYYKVSIKDAIVGDTPLILTNTDDDPPQLLVQDAIRTIKAWRCDYLWEMS